MIAVAIEFNSVQWLTPLFLIPSLCIYHEGLHVHIHFGLQVMSSSFS